MKKEIDKTEIIKREKELRDLLHQEPNNIDYLKEIRKLRKLAVENEIKLRPYGK